VNGKTFSKNLKIKNQDEIIIDIVIEKLDEISPEDMNLDVIYEDDKLIIINKEA